MNQHRMVAFRYSIEYDNTNLISVKSLRDGKILSTINIRTFFEENGNEEV